MTTTLTLPDGTTITTSTIRRVRLIEAVEHGMFPHPRHVKIVFDGCTEEYEADVDETFRLATEAHREAGRAHLWDAVEKLSKGRGLNDVELAAVRKQLAGDDA